MIIIFVNFVVAEEICGDGLCNAGNYNVNANEIEDASTCYTDCKNVDYVVCGVIKATKDYCYFRGFDYEFENIKVRGCIGTGQEADITIRFNEHERTFEDISTAQWHPLHDNVFFLISPEPCATYIMKATIYIKENVDEGEINNFLNLQGDEINKKKDSVFSIDYNFSLKMSVPYCKNIIRDESGEMITERNDLGCSSWEFSFEDIEAGKYTLNSQYWDKEVENKIGEQTIQIIVNDCWTDDDCDDGNFLTANRCVGNNNVRICSNKINYILIIGGIIILILIAWAFKKFS